jgi:hypothetical protein
VLAQFRAHGARGAGYVELRGDVNSRREGSLMPAAFRKHGFGRILADIGPDNSAPSANRRRTQAAPIPLPAPVTSTGSYSILS